eukprot:scaffold62612_cov45-Phaeocystis_antarctica.AAC.3
MIICVTSHLLRSRVSSQDSKRALLAHDSCVSSYKAKSLSKNPAHVFFSPAPTPRSPSSPTPSNINHPAQATHSPRLARPCASDTPQFEAPPATGATMRPGDCRHLPAPSRRGHVPDPPPLHARSEPPARLRPR